MASSTIIGLAILKVNWETRRIDYLENFVPMVAECIRLSEHDVISAPDLQEQFEGRFGLRLPQHTINTILRRVKKRGYVRLENGIFRPNYEKLEQLEFHAVQQKVVRMHEDLIKDLIAFCAAAHNVSWSVEDAEGALQTYLENNQLAITRATTYNTLIPERKHFVKGARFLVAKFVQHLQQTHSSKLEYLVTIVKGNMLANALFLPDPTQAERKFRRTEVYFDTTLLAAALGYASEAQQDACTELLELLYETGAELRCFQHTVEELRSILHVCESRIRRGQTRDTYGIVENLILKGYTASDVLVLDARLERNLRALRISVMDKPPYAEDTYKHVIDEKELETAIESEITYRSRRARQRDVDSISAIMRLRRGQRPFYVEESRAVFITANSTLAKVATEFC